MIVQRGFRAPPSYHTERLRKAPLGYFFDVMTNGFGAMPDYASQIPPRDRWCIVAYIRALQLSQEATMSDVPAGQKVPSEAPAFRGDPGSGATLPELQSGSGERKRRRAEMSAAHANNLDLMAPPVVKTIQRRSLVIGLIFSVISVLLGASFVPTNSSALTCSASWPGSA